MPPLFTGILFLHLLVPGASGLLLSLQRLLRIVTKLQETPHNLISLKRSQAPP